MILVLANKLFDDINSIDYSTVEDECLALETELNEISRKVKTGSVTFGESLRLQARSNSIVDRLDEITVGIDMSSSAYRALKGDFVKAAEQSLVSGRLYVESINLDCALGSHVPIFIGDDLHVSVRANTLNYLRSALQVLKAAKSPKHEKQRSLIELDPLIHEVVKDLAGAFKERHLALKGDKWSDFTMPRLLSEKREASLVWLALSNPELTSLSVGAPTSLQSCGTLSAHLLGSILSLSKEEGPFRSDVNGIVVNDDPKKTIDNGSEIYRKLGVVLNDDPLSEITVETVLRQELGNAERLAGYSLSGDKLLELALEADLHTANIDWDLLSELRVEFLSVAYCLVKARAPTELEVQLRTHFNYP